MSDTALPASLHGERTLSPFGRRELIVTGREQLGPYIVLRAADPDGPTPDPGQFAMLASAERWEGGEDGRPFVPRAFSYARFQDGEAHFLLEDVGPGTNRLCQLMPGEGLLCLGPLGRGFRAPGSSARAILVGGGVGIAPLAILQDVLESEGREHRLLLGFRDAAHLPGARLLRAARLSSDDGSAGHRGPVTDLLAAELDEAEEQIVYACGPPAMLEAVRELCHDREVPAQLALEAGMACGFGACFGCVVKGRDGSFLRVCLDGPVLDAAELERIEG